MNPKMFSTILVAVTIVFILVNLFSFFIRKSYRKSFFHSPLFFQLFFNMIGIAFGFACLYYLLSFNNVILRVDSLMGDPAEETFWNFLYFSGVTLLSIGYGDYVPVGSARLFAVIEAAIGILLPVAYFLKAMSNNDDKNSKH
ncbi:potassium channel family protein [Alkalihalobacillus deserti]|uniref:potassium channel family protein n=1 Tax=Alkalihalobacillus deserti TaxID=2879466 RepID=UPI0027E1FC25|nr:ion channel [Alkalihalobacillus deserti]